MPNRDQGNKFDSQLAYGLMKPSTNIFQPIAEAVSNVGTLVDTQKKKEKKHFRIRPEAKTNKRKNRRQF